jgi:hypothetical protein
MNTDSPLTACKALGRALAASHAVTGSWEATGAFLGVSGGLAYRIAVDGYEPRSIEARSRVGLPVNPVALASAILCGCGCGIAFLPVVPHQKRMPGHPRRR